MIDYPAFVNMTETLVRVEKALLIINRAIPSGEAWPGLAAEIQERILSMQANRDQLAGIYAPLKAQWLQEAARQADAGVDILKVIEDTLRRWQYGELDEEE